MTALLNSKFCTGAYSLKDIKMLIDYTHATLYYRSEVDPREEDNVPRVLLTGLSTSVVRKLKQVRKKRIVA